MPATTLSSSPPGLTPITHAPTGIVVAPQALSAHRSDWSSEVPWTLSAPHFPCTVLPVAPLTLWTPWSHSFLPHFQPSWWKARLSPVKDASRPCLQVQKHITKQSAALENTLKTWNHSPQDSPLPKENMLFYRGTEKLWHWEEQLKTSS